ncbi:ATP-grasp domain-containing protein [Leucobacter tenebrionis]|uniref:ATP-grasp domain-containing protein n=1 Tax=Leucobacter tenebrionis TaxID=2873270 RepID=UPI001CA7904E|nr:ATP-grasp domain-containing protein [Leucobacter tenebrionis]QZY53128.1 ATP-grasp domain-containing protein [Leucobacter tenebrionis]
MSETGQAAPEAPPYSWPEYFQPRVVRPAFGSGKLSAYCIALEAWRRDLNVTLIGRRLHYVEVSDGNRTVLFNHSRPVSLTTAAGLRTALNKAATTARLREAGISAPVTIRFESTASFEEVSASAAELGYPVVLKPLSGSLGNGVLVDIRDEEALRASHEWLVNEFGARSFVLENHFTGEDYRVYVAGSRYIATVKRVPANVVGDGHSTVSELIQQKNKVRMQNPFLSKGLIRKDREVKTYLEKQDLTYDSIPENGVTVRLRGKANASAGGDVVDFTDDLPAHIKEAAVQSLAALEGVSAAGVDILYDPSKPRGEDYVVIEMNSRAHIGVNMYPTEGIGRDVPSAIIDEFFPGSRRRNIRGLRNIRFNLPETLEPLANGRAKSVQLASLPARGFPMRRKLSLGADLKLTPAQKNRLLALSIKQDISGFLNVRTGELIVAGVEKSVTSFLETVKTMTGNEPIGNWEWAGILELGFAIQGE